MTNKSKYYPNTTQFPNALFDEAMAFLTSDEWKVLSYIVRRTYGFQKESDIISINQLLKGIVKKDGTVLDCGTGLSETRLYRAIKGLEESKILYRKKTGRYSVFSLNLIRGSSGETDMVDWVFLKDRKKKKLEKARMNTAKARMAKYEKTPRQLGFNIM